jgi:hypothetical protein
MAPLPLPRFRQAIPVVVALIAAGGADAACDPSRPPDTPTRNFEIRGATAVDRTTGLEWRRCSLGLTWTDGRCTGEAVHLGLEPARAAIRAEGGGWRLPTAQELDGILESGCVGPAINAEVFPDIGPAEADSDDWTYWSDTHYDLIPEMAWIFDFSTGITDVRSPGYALAVRPVRGEARPPLPRP